MLQISVLPLWDSSKSSQLSEPSFLVQSSVPGIVLTSALGSAERPQGDVTTLSLAQAAGWVGN